MTVSWKCWNVPEEVFMGQYFLNDRIPTHSRNSWTTLADGPMQNDTERLPEHFPVTFTTSFSDLFCFPSSVQVQFLSFASVYTAFPCWWRSHGLAGWLALLFVLLLCCLLVSFLVILSCLHAVIVFDAPQTKWIRVVTAAPANATRAVDAHGATTESFNPTGISELYLLLSGGEGCAWSVLVDYAKGKR